MKNVKDFSFILFPRRNSFRWNIKEFRNLFVFPFSNSSRASYFACLRTSIACSTCQKLAHVPTCLAYLRANVPCVFICQCVLLAYVLTCQHAFRGYVLKCQRSLSSYVPQVNRPCALIYSRVKVVWELMCSRANMSWVPCLTGLAWTHDILPKCFASSVSSFDATFFSFTAIVVEVVHTVGQV